MVVIRKSSVTIVRITRLFLYHLICIFSFDLFYSQYRLGNGLFKLIREYDHTSDSLSWISLCFQRLLYFYVARFLEVQTFYFLESLKSSILTAKKTDVNFLNWKYILEKLTLWLFFTSVGLYDFIKVTLLFTFFAARFIVLISAKLVKSVGFATV